MAKVALLIGVGNYEHPDDVKPLASAPRDVAAMQRILLNSQIGEFTEVIPLIDPDPMQMQEAIETLYRERAKDDLVLLFFSGHGIKDDSGKLYFATRSTRKTPKGDLIKSTAVPARFVHEIMSSSRSRRQIMILDCCFSGAFDPALNTKDDGSLDVQGQLGAEGRVVLTSSSSTQYSFEQQGSDLSIYTRFLVEGIETGAADRDSDGKVSVWELHEYASKKVQETAPKMNPKIIVLKDEGFDVVFAKAQIADPKLKYRKEAERYSMRGDISPAGRTVLNTQRVRLGLTLEEAQEIEDQVLQPFRERLKHLEDYRSAFVAEVERQYPLTPETLGELKDLQEIFGLREEDVAQIEQKVIAQVTSQSEAYQQLEQNRQQDAENLPQQQEAERLQTERQKVPPVVQPQTSFGCEAGAFVNRVDETAPIIQAQNPVSSSIELPKMSTISAVSNLRNPKLLIGVGVFTVGALTYIFVANTLQLKQQASSTPSSQDTCSSLLQAGSTLSWEIRHNGNLGNTGTLEVNNVDPAAGEWLGVQVVGPNRDTTKVHGSFKDSTMSLLNPNWGETWSGNCRGGKIEGSIEITTSSNSRTTFKMHQ